MAAKNWKVMLPTGQEVEHTTEDVAVDEGTLYLTDSLIPTDDQTGDFTVVAVYAPGQWRYAYTKPAAL